MWEDRGEPFQEDAMSLVDRFNEYAAAFEIVFEKDDWSLLEPYFTEDAVYETIADEPLAGLHEGRSALLGHLRQSLDSFDRRFEARELEVLEGPEERDGSVWMRWRATYRVADAPPLVMEGEEMARFQGDRIQRLEDRFAPNAAKDMLAWMNQHAARLPAS
jgi:hypothetical protein